MEPVEQKVYMAQGDGEHAYSKNSTSQRDITEALLLPLLDEALQQVSLPPSGKPIVVADMGCSSGPNTIADVSYIVEKLQSRCSDVEKMPREFQVYFNDLVWSDFNSLFKLLCSNEADRPKFHFAGVPGSFYDRLFPRTSVHIFISILSVHYLSKIPDSVTDENSPAFNKGELWLDGSTDATAQAYKEKFSLDLQSFLQARYEELAPGGLLCFIIKTRPVQKANLLQSKEDPTDVVQICLRETADELLSKGILTRQQLDSLNVPICFSLFREEVLEILKGFDSTFEILTAEERMFAQFVPHGSSSASELSDPNFTVRAVNGFARGILGGIFEQVMANEEQDIFWQQFSQTTEKYVSALRGNCQFGCISMLKK